MKRTLLIFLILFSSSPLLAKETIIFTGFPEVKISEGGTFRIPEKLTKAKAIEYKCTITKIGDKYFWTTRENRKLISVESGNFITYLAINGEGYVRVVKPEGRNLVRKIGAIAKDPEGQFDYVEHLLLGLKSVTYYGLSK